MRRMRFAGLVFLAAAAACSRTDNKQQAQQSDSTRKQTSCPANNSGITVPDGFCVTIFADNIGDARHIVVNQNGDVYVAIQGTEPTTEQKKGGDTTAKPTVAAVGLRDNNHDGVADTTIHIDKLGNTGIGIYNGYLYIDEGAKLVRHKLTDGQLAPDSAAEVVVSGIPVNPGHRARNFVIASDGSLYLNVGSATNSCQKQDRGTASPGIDPCTELNTRAGNWKFDANKLNQKFSSANRYATGIRNGMGLAFGPDGKLYGTQHGRDQLHDNWPKVFPDTKYQAENPGEEVIQINQGDNFGWPYCYYAMDQKKLVTAPEYGGDGKKTDRCTDKKEPLAVFPGHWAPMSLLFYSGTQFPAKYKNGAFIAFHGSWNRSPEPQEGYRVVFLPLTNGQQNGNYETFADGFAGLPANQIQPGSAKHRPVGLAQAPDGALYITDDVGGRIYRITYGGSK